MTAEEQKTAEHLFKEMCKGKTGAISFNVIDFAKEYGRIVGEAVKKECMNKATAKALWNTHGTEIEGVDVDHSLLNKAYERTN